MKANFCHIVLLSIVRSVFCILLQNQAVPDTSYSLHQLLLQEQSLRSNLEAEVQILRTQLETEKNKSQQLEQTMANLQRQVDSVVKNLTDVQTNAVKQFPQIAFSAKLSTSLTDVVGSKILMFDQVRTNLGGHYSTHTGVFHCTVSGLYFFAGSIVDVVGKPACISITKNGVFEIARPYSNPSTGHQSGSDFGFVHLSTGDEVYATVCQGVAQSFDHYTSFSGALIHSD